MDFARQCKRFQSYRVIDNRKLSNISSIGVLRHIQKITNNSFSTTYKIVLVDNDEKIILLINESDGQVLKEAKIKNLVSYGIACTSFTSPTNKPIANFIYISDYSNNLIHKFDENLTQVKQIKITKSGLTPLNGPCQIAINNTLEQIQLIDQHNCRLVAFDLKTDEYLSELKLFEEDLLKTVKYFQEFKMDLTAKSNTADPVELVKERTKLEFKPFGLYSKNERVYVTDWNRGFVYIYKNNKLERKIGGGRKFFTRPRDILLDSLDSILVSDLDNDSFYFLDNKGFLLFETKLPKAKQEGKQNNQINNHEKGAYGVVQIENKIVFARNSSIFICNLIN